MKISTSLKTLPIQRAAPIPPILSCEALRMDHTIRRIHELVQDLAPLSLVLEKYDEGELEIVSLEVKERGKGQGSQIMNIVCDLCDENGINLMLIPGGEGTKLRRLVRFYGKFGFDFDPTAGIMRREHSLR